jgi:hypothetical protein
MSCEQKHTFFAPRCRRLFTFCRIRRSFDSQPWKSFLISEKLPKASNSLHYLKNILQALMMSFQCSTLTTPDEIVGTFKQCARFQKDKDLDRFFSIVVLDGVGLVEDSPRMPLKVHCTKYIYIYFFMLPRIHCF